MLEMLNRRENYWSVFAHIRVNAVNCVGVAGRGISAQFKSKFPSWFRAYQDACTVGEIMPGDIWRYQMPEGQSSGSAATKNDWRFPSEITWVSDCFNNILSGLLQLRTPRTITIPALGCGLGGLAWKEVSKLASATLSHQDIQHHRIMVFPPNFPAGNAL